MPHLSQMGHTKTPGSVKEAEKVRGKHGHEPVSWSPQERQGRLSRFRAG